jgi:hypothetical protein
MGLSHGVIVREGCIVCFFLEGPRSLDAYCATL